MSAAADALLTTYLERLARATAGLPAPARSELVAEIRAHLAEVQASASSEAEIRSALDRLGPPEEVAAAAWAEQDGARPWTPDPARGEASRALDVGAVLLLIIGGVVLPVLGWIVGVVLLWVSRSWTTGEKWLGTLVPPGGLLFPASLLLLGGGSCVESSVDGVVVTQECTGLILSPWVGVPLTVLVAALPIVVGIVLLRRADRRREPRRPTATTSR